MKISEYNEMMAYLLRPRQKFAIGGGVVEGEDLGSREGFNNISKSEASFKFYEDKFGKKLLDEMAQEKYGKNFRDLDKNNQLKFFKSQLNKYEDFIKENKRYPNPTEAYNIGLTQGGKKSSILTDEVKTKIKNIYTSGEGGSTYISKKLAEEGISIDDSTIRRFITAEEEAGNIVRPTKFKTQEAKAPKDRYNIIRKVTERDLRGFTVGRSGTEVLAPEGSKYKITFKAARTPETSRVPLEYQGTQYYKTKTQADNALKGYKKFSKGLKKAGEAGRSLRDIILRDISDLNVESAILDMKEGEDLATAHRLSYKQVKKLGQLYNIANLGIEDPAINSGAIRRFENKLDRLYEEQRNLFKTAKRSTNKGLPVPKNLQDKIDLNNKKISAVVDLTDKRVQGILIDSKNLKPTTYGIDYIKTYGMGFLENKNVKDITDADLDLIQLNIENQIKRENKLGKKTESFLRDRQKFLKDIDKLAGPRGAEFAEEVGIRPKQINVKGLTAPGSVDTVTLGANPFFDPRNILTGLGDVARVLSTPTVAATFAGTSIKENLDKGESLPEALADVEVGTSLLYPELAKRTIGQLAPRGAGILSTIGRVAANPFFGAARAFTPIGAGLTAVGLAKDAYERYQELQAMSPEQREDLARERDEFSFGEFGGA